MSYPKAWAPDSVPAVWNTRTGAKPGAPNARPGYAPYKARMCSWCGALEFPDGVIEPSKHARSGCPRCPIMTEVGRAARPPKHDVSDDDEEPPRTTARKDGTMKTVTPKKKPTKEPPKTFSGVFGFRPGPELHERLWKLAEEDRRSLNDETIVLLEEAIAARGKKVQ